MLIVIDKRIPEEAKKRLITLGEIVEFSTQNITYYSISGHPDIFLCQTPNKLICAPNIPVKYPYLFEKRGVNFEFGHNLVKEKFPKTVFYNCVLSENILLHKKGLTDTRILELTRDFEFINLPQGYTRCSLMPLPSNKFITSDKGIEKVLRENKFEVYYFPPEEILLSGMDHGFIGGALGYFLGKLYIIGNPDYHSWGKEFRRLFEHLNIEIVSLYDGPFIDGGGIFFLDTN